MRTRYSAEAMHFGRLNVYVSVCTGLDYIYTQVLLLKLLGCSGGGEREENGRFRFHVPAGKTGPMSNILNQTFPLPSKSATLPGAFAMYTDTGPS
jgi:hypothetical protein